jgi:hypothetical protein
MKMIWLRGETQLNCIEQKQLMSMIYSLIYKYLKSNKINKMMFNFEWDDASNIGYLDIFMDMDISIEMTNKVVKFIIKSADEVPSIFKSWLLSTKVSLIQLKKDSIISKL